MLVPQNIVMDLNDVKAIEEGRKTIPYWLEIGNDHI